MHAAAPHTPEPSAALLGQLGDAIRRRRKTLGVSATVAAEAAGVSRMTLHRMERGAPSVTMGAWTNVLAALGLELMATTPDAGAEGPQAAPPLATHLPLRIPLADYPQLKALAWQIGPHESLTPAEAVDIYERNARHLDRAALSPEERALLEALHRAFGRHFV